MLQSASTYVGIVELISTDDDAALSKKTVWRERITLSNSSDTASRNSPGVFLLFKISFVIIGGMDMHTTVPSENTS